MNIPPEVIFETWEQLNKNFEDVSDDIDNLNKEISVLRARLSTQVVTYLLENEGYTTVLHANEHSKTKLVHAIIQAADNVKENITVHILRGNKDLCEPKTIKTSEKSGKSHTFELFKGQTINESEDIKLYSNNRRKVIVTLVLSSIGVKQ
jgi:hypothetical protein